MQRGRDGEDDLVALFADDAVYVEPFSDGAHHGIEAIRAWLHGSWELAPPELTLTVDRLTADGAVVEAHWTCDSPVFARPGRGRDRFTIADDRIVRLESEWVQEPLYSRRMGAHEPLDESTDHFRGASGGRLILEYGDYECPYSRQAFREIERVERRLHRQKALEDDDLRAYAGELGLDVERFDRDRSGADVRRRIERDMESGMASGEVRGTPTLFIDGAVYRGSYAADALVEALAAP
jgi:SnoaL-like domain/DSBA-like thioredoxin domain